jgi:hypothetical protein
MCSVAPRTDIVMFAKAMTQLPVMTVARSVNVQPRPKPLPNDHRNVAARQHVRTTRDGMTFVATGRQWAATNNAG